MRKRVAKRVHRTFATDEAALWQSSPTNFDTALRLPPYELERRHRRRQATKAAEFALSRFKGLERARRVSGEIRAVPGSAACSRRAARWTTAPMAS